MDRLAITSVEKSSDQQAPSKNRNTQRQEMQATLERMWHLDPEQFNPLRDSLQRQRLQRTLDLLSSQTKLEGKHAADLGCGSGVFSRMMRDNGSKVDAVDIAGNALKLLKQQDITGITPIQDCLPTTTLKDDYYDIVVCTELIGYIPEQIYRLLFAELSRIVKSDGQVICSTALDLDTEEPLERFGYLAETEFVIDRWVLSYHRLYIRLCEFFEKPSKNIKTAKVLLPLWVTLNIIGKPVARFLRQNQFMMNQLEKICHFILGETGISHALFIGHRRPMTFPLTENEMPREMKQKRQVWE